MLTTQTGFTRDISKRVLVSVFIGGGALCAAERGSAKGIHGFVGLPFSRNIP
jgi:hypothetical protein